MSTPEGAVKDAIKRWLRKRGAWDFMPVSNGYGRHGVPDHVACVPIRITEEMVGLEIGLFVGIEAKAPGKRNSTSVRQRLQLLAIEQAAGVAAVVSNKPELLELEGFIHDLLTGTKGALLPFTEPVPSSPRDPGSEASKPRGKATCRRAAQAGRDEGTA